MVTIEMLQRFCDQSEGRYDLTSPFSFGAFTYATNGHICIRVPRMAAVTRECSLTKGLPWDHDDIAGWQNMPSGYTVPPRILCPSCRGSKKYQPCLDCEFRPGCDEDPQYEARDCERLLETGEKCSQCEADGYVSSRPCFRVPMLEGGTSLNGEYLERLRILPGTIFLAPDPANPLMGSVRIRSTAGWDGLLMSMRPETGRIS